MSSSTVGYHPVVVGLIPWWWVSSRGGGSHPVVVGISPWWWVSSRSGGSHPVVVESSRLVQSVSNGTQISCYKATSDYGVGHVTCNCTKKTVSCSNRKLTEVPSVEFDPPITEFDLQRNFITDLPPFAFTRYRHLLFLDLSFNSINSLNHSSFHGHDNLRHLNLYRNRLMMYGDTFPEGVFRPLTALNELVLNGNHDDVSSDLLKYPDQALSLLVNLKHLSLDGLRNKTFGAGFREMRSLRNLTLSGAIGMCRVEVLTQDTFQYLLHLHYLDLSNCAIKGRFIHPMAFFSLTKLKSLNISNNEHIGIHTVASLLSGLINSKNLTELRMRLINEKHSLGFCINSSHTMYLPQKLEFLDAQENNFVLFGSGVIESLPQTLQTVDLSGNNFYFSRYLDDLKLWTNVKHLILSGSTLIDELPQRYPELIDEKVESLKKYTLNKSFNKVDFDNFSFPLPPNLEILEMNRADLAYKLTKFTVGENKLRNLSISNNSFPSLIGPITGLEHLEYLDISYSYVQFISDDFFKTLSTLVHLNLSNNLLGSFFNTLTTDKVFSSLTNLRVLDISSNFVLDFSEDVFVNLTKLEHLFLERNVLIRFDADISLMSSLTYLDFKSTRLTGLSSSFRTSIDQLILNDVSVSIDMADTPIHCDCENYDFLIWMKKSKAFNQSFYDYRCIYPDTKRQTITDGYDKDLSVLSRQCKSHVWVFCGISSAVLLVVIAVICCILYRYRWKIRYLYNAAYLQYTRSDRGDAADFKYDAFLCYDEEDHALVNDTVVPEMGRRGLKLCIHASDFIAGEFISSNIVKAVCSSRKTVVVLTKNLLSSHWCNFEIQMANMESLYTGRRVLVFLLVEKIPAKDLTDELLYYIRSNTYIQFPENINNINQVWLWDKIYKDIKV
ncbi:hypothetical protein Btru_004221 [Bulinus truncatus]|nr:hypothetical protein Btru_004221 [Bulinus truncatus]